MRLLLVVLILANLPGLSFADEPVPFGLTQRHVVDITVSAADYAAMNPPPTAPFGGGPRPPAAGAGRPGPGSPEAGAGNFGFEFEYVKAAVEIDGQKLADVGLRYKGSGTYMMSAQQVKRSLKLDFDRYDAKQTWRGEKKLNLNSGVMDPTRAREALAYAVFRAAGVPSPRTALAEVSITVPGKYDREPLGVFTAVEQVDKAFLKTHFQSSRGLLLKPEGIRGLPHFGPDPQAYEATYTAKTAADAAEWERLIELTRLINQASEAEFREQIGQRLDLEAFARFLACNTLLASLDGFIGLGHNYYLYCPPKSGKFVFIPWDLDLAFGAFPFFGSPQQLVELSVEHPHVGENKLIDRLLAMPEWKGMYRDRLRQLASEVFTPEKLGRDIAEVEDALKLLIAKDKAAADARKERGTGFGPGSGGPFGAVPIGLTSFVDQRRASVLAQLDGKSKGYVPSPNMMGFGGPPPPGMQLAKPLLDALDANKDGKLSEDEATKGLAKLVREWDTNRDNALDPRELGDGLQKLLPMPPSPMPPRR